MTRSNHDRVSPYVADFAARLNERLPEVARSIRASLEESIPELRGDIATRELLGTSVEGNVETILHALRHDIDVEHIAPPTAALAYARRLAQQGVPVNALVRAYRLGQRRMIELAFADVGSGRVPVQQQLASAENITALVSEYIDWITQQVVAVYEDERERWLDNQSSIRAVRVREILADKRGLDIDAASSLIRYPLRWNHVAAVLWAPDPDDEELTRMQKFVRDLAEAVGTDARPLTAAADRTSTWLWLPFRSLRRDVVDAIEKFADSNRGGATLALGPIAAGVEGFRSSHRFAQAARTVALARRDSALGVISATEPGLSAAALLGGDLRTARRWVSDTLGLLASDTENDARLRETLRVFLALGSSYKAAGDSLALHSNSVKYRVAKAIERRGTPIEADRLDVEIALLLCHWYGQAVLGDRSSD